MARRKNRNRNRRAGRKPAKNGGFAFPMPLASILAMAAVLSLAYLWLNARCEGLGRRIQTLEKDLTQVQHRVINEQLKWANMTTLPNIQKALKQHRVAMSWPAEGRVVRITSRENPMISEPPASELYAKLTRGVHEE